MIDIVVKKWLIKANQDLKVANLSLTYDNTLTDQICYHSQQSVEKFLKGYLISKDFKFPKTHNIEYLHEKCCEIDIDFNTLNVGNLSRYAVDIRYPESINEQSLKEANDAYIIALNVKKFVLNKLATNEQDLTLF